MTKSIIEFADEYAVAMAGVANYVKNNNHIKARAALVEAINNHRAAIIEELTGEMPEPVEQVWAYGNHECELLNAGAEYVTLDQLREYAAGLVAKRDAALDECAKALTVDASGKRVYSESRMKALAMIEAIRARGNV